MTHATVVRLIDLITLLSISGSVLILSAALTFLFVRLSKKKGSDDPTVFVAGFASCILFLASLGCFGGAIYQGNQLGHTIAFEAFNEELANPNTDVKAKGH